MKNNQPEVLRMNNYLPSYGSRAADAYDYFNAFHRSPMPMIIVDEKGKTIEHNQEYEMFMSDMIGATLRCCLGDLYQGFFTRLEREGQVDRLEIVVGEKQAFCSAHLISLPEQKRCYLVTIIPVSPDVITDEKLVIAGRLANGVAHDLNNIMAGIIGYIEMCNTHMKDNPGKAQQCCVRALRTAERARTLVQQMLMIAKHVSTEKKQVSLSPLVQEVISFLRVILPRNVVISVSDESRGGGVWADEIQLFQVLVNLGINAGDAMQEAGGKLEINLRNEGDNIELSIADTGCGIPEDHIDRIFEPSFTTKSKGYGLGLSVVFQAVREHGGAIRVASAQGKGTTFSICLPLFREDAQTSSLLAS